MSAGGARSFSSHRRAPIFVIHPFPVPLIHSRPPAWRRRKARQTGRLSRRVCAPVLLLGGAALVALVSLGFALAGRRRARMEPRLDVPPRRALAIAATPAALAGLRRLTLRCAP